MIDLSQITPLLIGLCQGLIVTALALVGLYWVSSSR